MRIKDVLHRKGVEVATIDADETVRTLLSHLASHGVGAMVVIDQAGALTGIVSERDVVRRLDELGPPLLDQQVRSIMTTEVTTCSPGDGVDTLMRLMTDQRIRHVPVVVDGRLGGIVSIGDIVKSRIDELQSTADSLESYITGR
jgi:CBS domain-containing protein